MDGGRTIGGVHLGLHSRQSPSAPGWPGGTGVWLGVPGPIPPGNGLQTGQGRGWWLNRKPLLQDVGTGELGEAHRS